MIFYYMDYDDDVMTPAVVEIAVKEKNDGTFVYNYYLSADKKRAVEFPHNKQRGNNRNTPDANSNSSSEIISEPNTNVNAGKFSMKDSVEETDKMIAWHNMSIEGLKAAAELGGLAMPSFAIKPADNPHLIKIYRNRIKCRHCGDEIQSDYRMISSSANAER